LLALYGFQDGGGALVRDSGALGIDLSIEDPAAVRWITGGGLRFEASTTARSDTPPTADADRLTHVAYTRDSEGAELLYADGVEIAGSTRPGDLSTWSSSALLAIGNEPTLDRPWLGTIHLAAVYARALSATEIAANRRAGLTLEASTPVPAFAPWMGVALAAGLLALGIAFTTRATPRSDALRH
jgi:hypothetical protein